LLLEQIFRLAITLMAWRGGAVIDGRGPAVAERSAKRSGAKAVPRSLAAGGFLRGGAQPFVVCIGNGCAVALAWLR